MSLFHPDESPEELHARVDDILERNTTVLHECIVCREVIAHDEVDVKTIHGHYHGYPKTCLEGHADEL